jgi:hypothetical protein
MTIELDTITFRKYSVSREPGFANGAKKELLFFCPGTTGEEGKGDSLGVGRDSLGLGRDSLGAGRTCP